MVPAFNFLYILLTLSSFIQFFFRTIFVHRLYDAIHLHVILARGVAVYKERKKDRVEHDLHITRIQDFDTYCICEHKIRLIQVCVNIQTGPRA